MDDVILGSGELYFYESSDGVIPNKDTDATIETDINHMGDIKGGARFSYKPSEYEVVNDKGEVVKRILTKEEVEFKSGILSWNIDNLTSLAPGELTNSSDEKIFRIGKGSKKLVTKLIRFIHTKDDGKKLRFTILGTASNGFEFVFDPSKETVIDAVFKAIHSTDGTILEVREQI